MSKSGISDGNHQVSSVVDSLLDIDLLMTDQMGSARAVVDRYCYPLLPVAGASKVCKSFSEAI